MGFFLVVAGWIAVVFPNGGVIITNSLMIILGGDIVIARLLAKVEAFHRDVKLDRATVRVGPGLHNSGLDG